MPSLFPPGFAVQGAVGLLTQEPETRVVFPGEGGAGASRGPGGRLPCVQDNGKHTTGPWMTKQNPTIQPLFLYMSDSISPLQEKYLNDVQANLDHVPSGDTEIHLLCACVHVCAYAWRVYACVPVCVGVLLSDFPWPVW